MTGSTPGSAMSPTRTPTGSPGTSPEAPDAFSGTPMWVPRLMLCASCSPAACMLHCCKAPLVHSGSHAAQRQRPSPLRQCSPCLLSCKCVSAACLSQDADWRCALQSLQHLEGRSRQDKRLHYLFQPAWLIRCPIHCLDQLPASSSHQHQGAEPLAHWPPRAVKPQNAEASCCCCRSWTPHLQQSRGPALQAIGASL